MEGVTTIEVLRAGYPIVAGLVMTILWLGFTHWQTRQNKENLFEFKDKQYSKDRSALISEIKEIRTAQEKIENKLEDKIDDLDRRIDSKLDRLFNEINSANKELARMEGRLYHKDSKNSDA